jgi:hypothetical protein
MLCVEHAACNRMWLDTARLRVSRHDMDSSSVCFSYIDILSALLRCPNLVVFSCRRYDCSHLHCMRTMADGSDHVTFTAFCCLGHICNRKWKRLGRFATFNGARQEIVRHLMVSGKHLMPEKEAIRTAQQNTVSGSDGCCIQEVYEGPLHGVNSSSGNNVRQRSRSRSGSSGARATSANLVPAAVVVDPEGYPVRLLSQIEEDASVIEQSIDALDRLADHISTYGGDTPLADVPHLLAHLTDYNLALKGHVDQLRVVVMNMRSYNI